MKRALTVLTFVCSTFTYGYTQLKPQAEIIDMLGIASCEDLSAHGAAFVQSVAKTPGSKGLIISYPEPRGRRIVTSQFRLFLANFHYYELDDQIEFIVGPERPSRETQFWLIPPGASEPKLEGEKWALTFDLTKPFIFDWEDEIGICNTLVVRKFADLLTANPRSKAHIIVKCSGRRRKCVFDDGHVKELTEKYNVARKRIRVFFAKSKDKLTEIEYWFVP
jgi:hypothetical protein